MDRTACSRNAGGKMTRKQSWQAWARACAADPSSPSNIGRHSLAALTGQDVRALNAIVACWELYAAGDGDAQRGALAAVRALLPAMQGSTRWIAKELIPYALDWSDRERLWLMVTDEERAGLRLVEGVEP